jgi:hypothetical protein
MRSSTILLSTVAVFVCLIAIGPMAQATTLKTSDIDIMAGTESLSEMDSLVLRLIRPQIVRLSWKADTGSVKSKDFKKLVSKEPVFSGDKPFYGVAKLCGRNYGFVLDSKDVAKKGYTTLYFDRNRNGDLTDDRVIKALPLTENGMSRVSQAMRTGRPLGRGILGSFARPVPKKATTKTSSQAEQKGDSSTVKKVAATKKRVVRAPLRGVLGRNTRGGYIYRDFPALKIRNKGGGSTAFAFTCYSRSSVNTKKVPTLFGTASFYNCSYRSGKMEVGGKERDVLLVDTSSNGKYNDPMKFRTLSSGRTYPTPGDMLIMDPDPNDKTLTRTAYRNPDGRFVSPVYSYAGKIFNLEVTANGKKVELTSTSVDMGKVECKHDDFSALLFNDTSLIKVAGNKGDKIELPCGEWKLYTYTIDHSDQSAVDAAKKKIAEQRAEGNLRHGIKVPYTKVAGSASSQCKPIMVAKGKTAALPFGPPFKPSVTVGKHRYRKDEDTSIKKVKLNLKLIDASGAACSSMSVNGSRPEKPTFVVANSKGKIIERGAFEYG